MEILLNFVLAAGYVRFSEIRLSVCACLSVRIATQDCVIIWTRFLLFAINLNELESS